MAGTDRPIVVGGGAAGLAACRTLEAAGHAPILLEAGDRLGGRLRTERMAGGTAVDRGFQVLLTAYPELRRWVDLAALDPVAFIPGAMIRKGGAWKTVADPRRLPGSILATLTSGVGTWGDRIRILRLVAQACS
ncbi:MAG: FAD-dependent oxidoreductase, partial [Flavobacteriales bacterium]